MKLKEWAEKNSVSYRTAWEHFRTGKIKNAYKLPTGTIVVQEDKKETKEECIVTYARVSSSENKSNLENQSKRLIDYCNAKGWQTHLNIQEIGSGLNENRKKLIKLLEEGKITKLIIEHKDRLTRFGFNYIKILCKHIGCDLVVLNEQKSDRDDLMQDFVSLVTSFCARLYGQRRSKRKTEQIIKELKTDD